MKVKSCKADYLSKAQNLSMKKAERLMSRMSFKLQSQLIKDGTPVDEILGIQLEIEDEQLTAWREMIALIRKDDLLLQKLVKSPESSAQGLAS
ncbi:hypothetical protein LG201_07050 [Methylobacillus gramineus]|uniref:hypothetical protein n=1 Tax=Methylobacillus gramineus TaxID=755169 RepID=UPI001CFFD432|nr:hypothetical protein [Methylobacillus gramineus]MCB5184959.1 hypothetical protein [Methylobacillus gramineus]